METAGDDLRTSENSVTINQSREIDERSTKALLRIIDLRLMPLLTLLYIFSYLDRINIGLKRFVIYIQYTTPLFFIKGNARLFGLEHDLHLLPSEYNWAVSIFFISYVSM